MEFDDDYFQEPYAFGDSREDVWDYASLDESSEHTNQISTVPMEISEDSSSEVPRELVRQVADPAPNTTPPPGTVASTATRQIEAKRFFLTAPQCPKPAAEVLSAIKELVGEEAIDYCVVSHELHADGNSHIHVALVLKDKIRYSAVTNDYWDVCFGKHGNYLLMKYPAKCLAYVIKHGDIICHPSTFDPESKISSRAKNISYQKEVIAKKILETPDTSMLSLAESHPGFMLLNMQRVQAFSSYVQQENSAAVQLKDLPAVPPNGSLSEHEQLVLQWLHQVKSFRTSRGHQHLRIEGPTGVGKSTLLFVLRSYLRVYVMPYENNDWMDTWDDKNYDIVVFDEFKAQKTLQFLNTFSDGMGYQVKRRGSAPSSHMVKTPCVILSNYTWSESYMNCTQSAIDAAERRFQTIPVEGSQNFFGLIDLLQE